MQDHLIAFKVLFDVPELPHLMNPVELVTGNILQPLLEHFLQVFKCPCFIFFNPIFVGSLSNCRVPTGFFKSNSSLFKTLLRPLI